MLKYSDFVLDVFYNPVYAGTIKGYYGMGRFKDIQQDEDLKIFVVIESDKIKDIRYQTSGSIISHVALSVLSELAIGRTIDEAKGITVHDLLKKISQVPKSKISCLPSAIECLKVALKNAEKSKATMKEFSAEVLAKNFGTTTKLTRLSDLEQEEAKSPLVDEPLKEVASKKVEEVKDVQKTTKAQEESKPVEKKARKTEENESSKVVAKKDKPLTKKTTEKVVTVKEEKQLDLSAKQSVVAKESKKAEKKQEAKKALEVKTADKKKSSTRKKEDTATKIAPVKEVDKSEEFENTPTKIEIRVVDDPSSKAEVKTPEQEFVENKNKGKAKTKKTTAKKTPQEKKEEPAQKEQAKKPAESAYHSIFKIEEKSEPREDELADEIDTITAKLTDAISKLNFKFEDDDIVG